MIIFILSLLFFLFLSRLFIYFIINFRHKRKEKLFHEFMHDEQEEIKKYKWIESENAGKDVGNKACIEWIERYAKDFRKKWYKDHKFWRKK